MPDIKGSLFWLFLVLLCVIWLTRGCGSRFDRWREYRDDWREQRQDRWQGWRDQREDRRDDGSNDGSSWLDDWREGWRDRERWRDRRDQPAVSGEL